MKIIALMPVKNEAHVLPTCLSSLVPIVDEIVALDDGSDDGSRDLIRAAGGFVEARAPRDQLSRPISSDHRRRLLELGRERGGTHFVWLDADEAFTAPFIRDGRSHIEALRPGEKLLLQWIALWRSLDVYRDDRSMWSNSFKDFIVADDGESDFAVQQMHEGRTPGRNAPSVLRKLSAADGAVFHFQFVAWDRFQMKQAWYRCWELVAGLDVPASINRRYRGTLDEDGLRTSSVPGEWYEGLVRPVRLEDVGLGWYRNAILDWFDECGVERFEPLEIWHIADLRREFVARSGRAPRPQLTAIVKASAVRAGAVERLRALRARLQL
jgi:glycosyltransferase involved in cell wall biosynthesis